MTDKSYDEKCYDLAEHFLSDCDPYRLPLRAKEELSTVIQRAIEDWLEGQGL